MCGERRWDIFHKTMPCNSVVVGAVVVFRRTTPVEKCEMGNVGDGKVSAVGERAHKGVEHIGCERG